MEETYRKLNRYCLIYFHLSSSLSYQYLRYWESTVFALSRLFHGWWRELKLQTVETANAHAKAGNYYHDMSKELLLFSEEQSKLMQIVGGH